MEVAYTPDDILGSEVDAELTGITNLATSSTSRVQLPTPSCSRSRRNFPGAVANIRRTCRKGPPFVSQSNHIERTCDSSDRKDHHPVFHYLVPYHRIAEIAPAVEHYESIFLTDQLSSLRFTRRLCSYLKLESTLLFLPRYLSSTNQSIKTSGFVVCASCVLKYLACC